MQVLWHSGRIWETWQKRAVVTFMSSGRRHYRPSISSSSKLVSNSQATIISWILACQGCSVFVILELSSTTPTFAYEVCEVTATRLQSSHTSKWYTLGKNSSFSSAASVWVVPIPTHTHWLYKCGCHYTTLQQELAIHMLSLYCHYNMLQ